MLAVCMNIIFLPSFLSVFVAILYLVFGWEKIPGAPPPPPPPSTTLPTGDLTHTTKCGQILHNYNTVFDVEAALSHHPLDRGYCSWGRERPATCVQTVPVFSIIFSKIINEYCSRVIYCFKIKHKFKKNSVQSQDTTPDPPCIIIRYLEYT